MKPEFHLILWQNFFLFSIFYSRVNHLLTYRHLVRSLPNNKEVLKCILRLDNVNKLRQTMLSSRVIHVNQLVSQKSMKQRIHLFQYKRHDRPYQTLGAVEEEQQICTYGQTTVVQSSQEYGRQYWATCLFICSFARTANSFARTAHSFAPTAHSFACSALLASLARSLICSFAHSLPCLWERR